ncbi:MAG TPA: FTR1 family protein [Candidatus Limnocylindria bacterium]|jgi:high-affinity iron transporter|nr:FTR1 family protein [Candidatus Limnocylindria bacterium]
MSAADLSALVIALREGIEIALVVGILLAYLTQVGARGAHRWVWLGVALATGVSLGFLGVLNALNAEFEGATEQIFEGVTMVLAAVFLTWMIFWMLRNSRYLKVELQRSVQAVLDRGGMAWGLFFLAFFAVVREGVELALLLFAAPGEGKLVGSIVGLAAAVGVGVLIYAFGRRIDLRTFFRVTSILLVLFAAGLVAHAAHEFAEAGILAAVEGPKLWSTRSWLPDDQGLGSILRALFGYQDEPTVIEVLTYLGYFVGVWLLSRTRMATAPITAKASRAA